MMAKWKCSPNSLVFWLKFKIYCTCKQTLYQARDLTQLTNFNETFSGQQLSGSLVSLCLKWVSVGGNDCQFWWGMTFSQCDEYSTFMCGTDWLSIQICNQLLTLQCTGATVTHVARLLIFLSRSILNWVIKSNYFSYSMLDILVQKLLTAAITVSLAICTNSHTMTLLGVYVIPYSISLVSFSVTRWFTLIMTAF